MNWEDRIDDYLDDALSTGDRASFEKAMAEDAQLQATLELHRDARTLLKVAARQELKSRISKLDSEAKNKRSFSFFKIAAAVIILLGAALAWNLLSTNTSPSVADYFEPYPDRITVMGNSQNELRDAMRDYNAGNYENAAQAFSKMNTSNDPQLTLYQGVCLIGIDSCLSALKQLEGVADGASSFREAALWYQILATLQCNKNDEAMALTKRYLSDDQHRFNRGKAKALLQQLEDVN